MPTRIMIVLLLASFALPSAAHTRQPYIVSDGDGGGAGGNLWRLEDLNGDGDALDAGERTLWATGFNLVLGLETVGPAVHVVESGNLSGSNEIIRLVDANDDGDALDIGERVTWSAGLDNPTDIARSGEGGFYITEFDRDEVWKLVDINGDGDALDLGERTLFADAIDGPRVLLPWTHGGVLASAFFSDDVYLLDDSNGDGDALDVAERVTVVSGIGQVLGMLDDGSGGFHLSSSAADTVFHAADKNGDGDYLDIGEILSYTDVPAGSFDRIFGMAAFDDGGFLLADSANDEVKWVRDLNSDGDALDVGEVVLFAQNIIGPVDIVSLTVGLPGDYNNNGVVDAADYTAWRDALTAGSTSLPNDPTPGSIDESDFLYWRSHFGEMLGSGADARQAAVPEPATLTLMILAAAGWCLRRARSV